MSLLNLNDMKENLDKPKYALSEKQSVKGNVIIPIHGSIRICRCLSCGRTLNTEAAALSKTVCTRCGSEVNKMILPTTEGTADQKVLELFKNKIKKSNLIMSFGFAFDDPHISYKIGEGNQEYATDEKAPEDKLMINCSIKKLDRGKVNWGENVKFINSDEDLLKSLKGLISVLNPPKKSVFDIDDLMFSRVFNRSDKYGIKKY